MIGRASVQQGGRLMYPAAVGHGYTWNPAYAHPDALQPEEDPPMTVLTDEGDVAVEPRRTPTMGYELPPPTPRAEAAYDGWGRYKLPSPTTGRPTGFTRATTVADTLDDTYNLNRWKRRETAKRIIALADEVDVAEIAGVDIADNDLLVALRQAVADDDKSKLDAALDAIDNAMGGRDAAELGTAVHAWVEAIDLGLVTLPQVPEMFQPYVVAYLDVLARHGLVAVPDYCERIVLNDRGEETIVGTLDRIYLCVATGELILGDVKTSKTLEYSYLSYAVQLAVYGYATRMLSVDGKTWGPMPPMKGLTDEDMENEVRPYGVIIHVPSDQPERSSAVTMDLWFGAETMVTALETRRRRKQAKSQVPYVHALPAATRESLRYVEARQAMMKLSSSAELEQVWESYQDIWDDDLTALGEQLAQVL
ncbi:exonuclease [Gordonia phage Yago84]|nr:exonuclease [Gordonia phage Yago84]QIG58972.1 exonuclease [Gordonia phage AnClar]WIC90026.1 Cas4 exonuclease [Gordonia phage Sisko]